MSTQEHEADTIPGLLPHHLRQLRESGLKVDTIKAAGILSETSPQKLAAMLGWQKLPKNLAPAIVFPFVDADGRNGYYRARPDTPRKIKGKPVKYESPLRQPNRIYIPPGVADLLTHPDAELLISEGEKKSLAATQHGFPCIGLVGVFGWKEKDNERLLGELERVKWSGRKVFIVFDSDLERKQDVQLAERRLAKHLIDRGAIVRCARLPDGPEDESGSPVKMGLDDFLVAHDPLKLRKLLVAAVDPEPLTGVEAKVKASEIDPASEAEAMLAAQTIDGVSTLRYWRGIWLRWKNNAYSEVAPAEIRARMVRFLNQHYRKLSQRITGDVLDQLKAQAVLWGKNEPPAWINGDTPWPADEVLATQNALVHLPSLIAGSDCILAPTPRFFTTAALDYCFAADAPRPERWLSFLSELWPDDAQAIATLQEWFGYCLTLDTSLQKMLVLIGPKRSGKGTIARVLRKLVGPANVAGPSLAAFAQQFGLWSLIGKPLAIIHDARLGGRSDQAIIVERILSTTGEDAQTIDRKMLEHWTGKLPTRLMMLTNELPRLHDSSGALVGRMILVRMTESFYGRENPALTDQLLNELPGILLWSIEGWRRLREHGRFIQPESATELLTDMADLASPIGAFICERCVVAPGQRAAVADLYLSWRNWCDVHGRKEPGTEQSFGRDLLAAVPGLRRCRPRDGEDRYRCYDGIGLI